MKKLFTNLIVPALICFVGAANADTITVNTENNLDFSAGKTNLYLALTMANTNGAAANTVNFSIPGLGAHYIKTPTNGYPLITNHNITIDGYSQPGSAPNSNPILAANNAQIKIVLDSRLDFLGTDFLATSMDYAPGAGNTGFGAGDVAILGLFRATNFWVKGLCFLGQLNANYGMYGVAMACDFNGTSHHCHVSGCWFGVDLDETSVVGNLVEAIANARHRDNPATAQVGSDYCTIGVAVGSPNPRAEFNVFVGAIETINIEANNGRISGNFIGVYPSGNKCWTGPLDADPAIGDIWRETHIEIGRFNKNTVIGVDGDGVNDADERNIFGGVLDTTFWPLYSGYTGLRAYTHTIEFYGNNTTVGANFYGPSTNNIIAGNYFGVGVDGVTRFTNGVPPLDGGNPQTRFGSDGDGVSDNLEGNVVFGNYPTNIYDPSLFLGNGGPVNPATKSFYDGLGTASIRNAQRNKMVNNFPFPSHPASGGGTFLINYYNQALLTPATLVSEVYPTIDPSSTAVKLKGTIPIANATYPTTIIDVYTADPEGISNGLLAADPDQPNGWIQGKTHLGTFVAGSGSDLDPTAGGFEFDTSSSPDVIAGNVTITATYSQSPAGTHNAIGITSPFATPVNLAFVPRSAESVGLTRIVPDTLVWYSSSQGISKIGGYAAGDQPVMGSSVEATASVLGDSTFLLAATTQATNDDGNMSFTTVLIPAAGGASKLNNVFYTDAGTIWLQKINESRQTGNPGRIGGDPRYGAVNYGGAGEVSLWNYPAFNSDGRFNPADPFWTTLAGVNGRSYAVQFHQLNPSTLASTPLSKAIDNNFGRCCLGASYPNTGTQDIGRDGSWPAGLDNGNFIVVGADHSGLGNPGGPNSGRAPHATLYAPDGSVLREWIVPSTNYLGAQAGGSMWNNVGAFKGGFCVKPEGGIIYFYNNAGDLQGTVDVNNSAGVNFDVGRSDGTRLCADIRSHYVFMAGKSPESGSFTNIMLCAWDANTRTWIGNTIVSDEGNQDPTTLGSTRLLDRCNVACDAYDRVTVAYRIRPDRTAFAQDQIAGRVFSFDGTKFTALTPTFFPFIEHDSDPASLAGFKQIEPSVAMTPRQILFYAKGMWNGTASPTTPPVSLDNTHCYTILSHPAPIAAPVPVISMAKSGSNLDISWNPDDGLFTVQTKSSLAPGAWANATAGNVAPPVSVPIGTGTQFIRLAR